MGKMLARETLDGRHIWHNKSTLQQDAQKGRPLRPSFVKRRSFLVADPDAEFLRDRLHDSRSTGVENAAGGLFQHPASIEGGNRKKWQAAALVIVVKTKSVCLSVVDCHPFHPCRTSLSHRNREAIDLMNVVVRLDICFQRDTEAQA